MKSDDSSSTTTDDKTKTKSLDDTLDDIPSADKSSPGSVVISIRFPAETIDRIDAYCKKLQDNMELKIGISRADVIRSLIDKALEGLEE
jgi:hypothetical protein